MYIENTTVQDNFVLTAPDPQIKIIDTSTGTSIKVVSQNNVNYIQSFTAGTNLPRPICIQSYGSNNTAYFDVSNQNTGLGGNITPSYSLDVSGVIAGTSNLQLGGNIVPYFPAGFVQAQASPMWNPITISTGAQTINNKAFGGITYITLVVPSGGGANQTLQLQGNNAPAGSFVRLIVDPNSPNSQNLDVYNGVTQLVAISKNKFGKVYQFLAIGTDNFINILSQ
jgi:hypothetical protein